MEANRAEFDSPDVREGEDPSAIFDRPLLKYMGFALLLAWHYVLWFVPSFFFHTQLLDESVTLSWVASLLATAAFLFVLAGLLGRKRHLSDYPAVLPAAMIVAAASTVALGFFPFHLAPAGLYLVVIIALSASEAALWILWGERYACVKANFTINHIGTIFGITLFLCVLIASLLPPTITAPATALLPLASGALLALARKDGQRTFPVLLPRSATNSGFKNMLGVGFVTLLACAACYFLCCIIPWEMLPTGEDSFTFGILGGALFILVLAGIYTLSRDRLNIFKIYPALLVAVMIGFSLFLSSALAYFPAFIIGIGVQALFEVLLIMYFGILTTKGYATPALTFAMAGGFVRLGLVAGNSLALWYESMAAPVAQALTPPTSLHVPARHRARSARAHGVQHRGPHRRPADAQRDRRDLHRSRNRVRPVGPRVGDPAAHRARPYHQLHGGQTRHLPLHREHPHPPHLRQDADPQAQRASELPQHATVGFLERVPFFKG